MTGSAPRRRLSAEQRREQLERATWEEVAAVGFAAASAEAIARRAQVSKGLLWHYYADVEDLMAAAARSALADLERAVAGDLDLTAAVPDLLRAAVHRAATLPRTHGPQLRAMQQIIDNLRDADGRRRLGLADYDALHQAQAALFRRGQEEGHVARDRDPTLLAVAYQGLVDTMLGYLETRPELDPREVADRFVEVLLAGVLVPQPG